MKSCQLRLGPESQPMPRQQTTILCERLSILTKNTEIRAGLEEKNGTSTLMKLKWHLALKCRPTSGIDNNLKTTAIILLTEFKLCYT